MAGSCLAPGFLWVLRDFALVLEDDSGRPLTEREYLEQTLRRFSTSRPPPEAANVAQWEDQREQRQRILDLFPRRDCATLVRPADEEDQLQRLGELPLSALRPKFVAQVQELRQKVFSACHALQSPTGKPVSGSIFLSLLEAHVDVLNKGAVPQVGSAWQQVSRQECGRAIDDALRVFSAACLDVAMLLPASDEDLVETLQVGIQAAHERFEAVAMGSAEILEEYRADVNHAIEDGMDRLRKDNETIAVRHNEAWLQKEYDSLVEDLLKQYRPRFDAGVMKLEECDAAEKLLKSGLEQLRSAYQMQAVGPVGAREGPFEQVAGRQGEAAKQEIAHWRIGVETSAAAAAAGKQAAAVERAQIEAAGEALSRKVAQEIEDSKQRQAKLEEGRGGAGEVEVDASAVRLIEDKLASQRVAGKGNSSTTATTVAGKPKCCVVQ